MEERVPSAVAKREPKRPRAPSTRKTSKAAKARAASASNVRTRSTSRGADVAMTEEEEDALLNPANEDDDMAEFEAGKAGMLAVYDNPMFTISEIPEVEDMIVDEEVAPIEALEEYEDNDSIQGEFEIGLGITIRGNSDDLLDLHADEDLIDDMYVEVRRPDKTPPPAVVKKSHFPYMLATTGGPSKQGIMGTGETTTDTEIEHLSVPILPAYTLIDLSEPAQSASAKKKLLTASERDIAAKRSALVKVTTVPGQVAHSSKNVPRQKKAVKPYSVSATLSGMFKQERTWDQALVQLELNLWWADGWSHLTEPPEWLTAGFWLFSVPLDATNEEVGFKVLRAKFNLDVAKMRFYGTTIQESNAAFQSFFDLYADSTPFAVGIKEWISLVSPAAESLDRSANLMSSLTGRFTHDFSQLLTHISAIRADFEGSSANLLLSASTAVEKLTGLPSSEHGKVQMSSKNAPDFTHQSEDLRLRLNAKKQLAEAATVTSGSVEEESAVPSQIPVLPPIIPSVSRPTPQAAPQSVHPPVVSDPPVQQPTFRVTKAAGKSSSQPQSLAQQYLKLSGK